MICEKCGHKMIEFKEHSSIGYQCANCNWGIITSYIDPIFKDENKYTIILLSHQIIDKEQLKVIAQIKECNYIKAKKYMLHGESTFICDKAPIVQEIARKLLKAGVNFEIDPDYIYEY